MTVGKKMMIPLPETWTQQDWFHFQFVGIHFFGPILARCGRKTENDTDVFNSFPMRAVRLEVSHSFCTNFSIIALLRFMSKREAPSEVFSDNGTNFVGAQQELESPVQSWSTGSISDRQWNFDPLTPVTEKEYALENAHTVFNLQRTVNGQRSAGYLYRGI